MNSMVSASGDMYISCDSVLGHIQGPLTCTYVCSTFSRWMKVQLTAMRFQPLPGTLLSTRLRGRSERKAATPSLRNRPFVRAEFEKTSFRPSMQAAPLHAWPTCASKRPSEGGNIGGRQRANLATEDFDLCG